MKTEFEISHGDAIEFELIFGLYKYLKYPQTFRLVDFK